ncbi:lutropin subunit beta [Esox lucius]|uniref:Glycoprotein hormone subunit beta domain-containing protein n=1 Tax=Esox lucius TaxID=8010 RepID=A0A3P9A1S5_ESOLU|nr:lutropin subunit beta [Esox lucius]
MLRAHVSAWMLSLFLCVILDSVDGSAMQPCKIINQTVSLEKEGCPTCLVIQSPICSGHCLTKEPVYKSPFSTVYQHVCTYRDVRYETLRLPDCPPWVDPHVTYPVALSCTCSLCVMDTSDCTMESLQPDFCMSERVLVDGDMW